MSICLELRLSEQRQRGEVQLNVIFEGLPGAGKSTVIAAIQRTTENGQLLVLDEFLNHIPGDPRDIAYFLNNEAEKNERMKGRASGMVLCDRLWQSTLVYNAVACNVQSPDELLSLQKIIYKNKTFEDYIYVYLSLPSSMSLSRHSNTGMDDCIWFNPTFNSRAQYIYEMLYDNLERFSPNVISKIRIQTDQKTEKQVLAEIIGFLESICPDCRGKKL
ncbi:thymidylate kinase [compost metagenome]